MKKQSLRDIDNLIIDMDGVLWRGSTPLPGIIEFFGLLDKLSINFILATNNSTKISEDYEAKLASFGVHIPAKRILGSAEATAMFLSKKYPKGSRVLVIGEEGLRKALLAQGLSLMDSEGNKVPAGRADAVVVGLSRQISYEQFANAVRQISSGAEFVGTNPDVTFPTEHGRMPGAGALLAFIEASTGVKPNVVGKPHAPMFDEAMRRLGGRREATAIAGDRLNTDIAGGQAAGIKTILLLTGVTKREDLSNEAIKPDWVMADLDELTMTLGNSR